MALRHDYLEKDFMLRQFHQINTNLALLGGAKLKDMPKFKPLIKVDGVENDEDDIPTVEQALAALGGSGTAIVRQLKR